MIASGDALDPDFPHAVLHDLGAGVLTIDSEGLITYVNPWAQRLLGWHTREMLGRDAHDLLHRRPDGSTVPRERCVMRVPLHGSRSAEEGSAEYYLRADGTLLPIIWSTTPLVLKDRRRGLVVVFSDFSPHREAETRVAAHTAALESLTRRLNLLVDVSAALMSTVDAPSAVRRLLPLLVPELGDWGAVDLHRARSGTVQRVAVRSPAHPHRAKQLEGPVALPDVSFPAAAPAARGDGLLLLTAAELRDARTPLAASHRVLFEHLGGHTATVVPIRTRRHRYGLLTIGHSGDVPTGAEARLLADIGRRLGLVVDNARLYHEQRNVAETMQRRLLAPLPQVDHLRMTARYLPAQSAMDIGGDWYDAFLLADGAMALVIGDVVGHDLQAAAHMAEVRNMLRAVAWTHVEPPSMIVRRLDEAVTHTSDAPMATLIFARVEGPEGGPWRLHWASAGHPPPLLITPDGHTRFLTDGHGPLIGMNATLQLGLGWADAQADLPAGSTLLIYTDGLVENRHRPIDVGMAKLRHHASLLARRPSDQNTDAFCDELLERLAPGGDDTALLALRLPAAGTPACGHHGPPPSPASRHNPAAPGRSAPGSVPLHAPVEDPSRSRDPRGPTGN
ncbi:SpoIIE family protein phosphatase [Streptomyces mexicanus]|uniref:SpoIIE family protein phosphatase n=1 Tax=Streptomyces mexicanus TaxID=178566 RepID=UPI0036BB9568